MQSRLLVEPSVEEEIHSVYVELKNFYIYNIRSFCNIPRFADVSKIRIIRTYHCAFHKSECVDDIILFKCISIAIRRELDSLMYYFIILNSASGVWIKHISYAILNI